MFHQRLEQEQKEMIARQTALEVQQAKEETDRIFLEKQQQKAQKAKEEGRSLQDHYVQQIVSFNSSRGEMPTSGEFKFPCSLLTSHLIIPFVCRRRNGSDTSN